MLHCYFVARATPAIEGLSYPTLSPAPLEFIRFGELAAAVRRVVVGRRSTPESMLEYNAVLATASRQATVLPLPFGARFRSEAGLLRLLRARARELVVALDRLEGKVEMSLRVRIARREDAEDKAQEIHEGCQPLESLLRVRTNALGQIILEIFHLVDRRDAADYGQRVAAGEIEVTGPWPPLHFLPHFLRAPVRAERGGGRARASGAAAG